MQRARLVEPRAQPFDAMQLDCDVFQRARGIVRELAETTFASRHVRPERAYKPVRLVDQAAELRLGHGLIGEDLAKPFEQHTVWLLDHLTELTNRREPAPFYTRLTQTLHCAIYCESIVSGDTAEGGAR